MPMQVRVFGIEVEARFDAGVRGDQAIGQLVVRFPRHRAQIIHFAELARADEQQALPQMQCGEQAARSRRARGLGQRSAELDARLALGHHDRAVLFGQIDGDIAAASVVLPLIFQFQPVSAKSPWARYAFQIRC